MVRPTIGSPMPSPSSTSTASCSVSWGRCASAGSSTTSCASTPAAVTAAFEGGATVLFGVPTMYHRLAAELERDAALADALRGARLLVSGSAALAAPDFDRVARATGQRVAERYGLTETLMNTAVRASGERRPGYVGEALSGVELRLVGDDGEDIEASDDDTIGELAVRGPNLFSGYLNRPDATDEAFARAGSSPATWPPGRPTATGASSGGGRPT